MLCLRDMVNQLGLDRNKLAQVRDIARYFSVSFFWFVVNTILDRRFFKVRSKKGIQLMRAFEHDQ